MTTKNDLTTAAGILQTFDLAPDREIGFHATDEQEAAAAELARAMRVLRVVECKASQTAPSPMHGYDTPTIMDTHILLTEILDAAADDDDSRKGNK